jgi:hypothetical protein
VVPTDKGTAEREFDMERYVATRNLDFEDVLLIDDTWTTGASAQNAAWALKQAGAETVGYVGSVATSAATTSTTATGSTRCPRSSGGRSAPSTEGGDRLGSRFVLTDEFALQSQSVPSPEPGGDGLTRPDPRHVRTLPG